MDIDMHINMDKTVDIYMINITGRYADDIHL